MSARQGGRFEETKINRKKNYKIVDEKDNENLVTMG